MDTVRARDHVELSLKGPSRAERLTSSRSVNLRPNLWVREMGCCAA